MGKENLSFTQSIRMRAVTIFALILAITMINAQALRDKVVCCKDQSGNVVPTINSCGSRRRMQALAPSHCAAKLTKAAARRLQAIVPAKKEFAIQACSNFSARRLAEVKVSRKQALVLKCPVTVDGWRCFTNDKHVTTCPNNFM